MWIGRRFAGMSLGALVCVATVTCSCRPATRQNPIVSDQPVTADHAEETRASTTASTPTVAPSPVVEDAAEELAAQDTCNTAADCAWGEIAVELRTAADCMCLFDCPHLPLNKTTVTRRLAQHRQLCNPKQDAHGKVCPIDDCASPGAIVCLEGRCKAAKPRGPKR